jgi:hypothetical protein
MPYFLIVLFVGIVLVLLVCACIVLRCVRSRKRRGDHTFTADVMSNPMFFSPGPGRGGGGGASHPSLATAEPNPHDAPDVVRTWRVGETTTTRVTRGPNGLGTKLEERNGGAVYLVGTTKGSTAERTFGSTRYLGILGLRVVKVFGVEVTSKAHCVELLKSQPERPDVDVEVRVPDASEDTAVGRPQHTPGFVPRSFFPPTAASSSLSATTTTGSWQPGQTVTISIARGPSGLGMKLEERDDGAAVYVTSTVEGSPSSAVLGGHIGSSGLEVVSVFGQPFLGKAGCIAMLKSQPELSSVEVTVRVPGAAPQHAPRPAPSSAASTQPSSWRPGEVMVVTIPRGPKGLGTKLEERDGGAVFITATSGGSPSEQVLGQSLPPSGLQILKIYGESFLGKEQCVALLKSHAQRTSVEMELRAAGVPSALQLTQSASWKPGEVIHVTIPRGPKGLGTKLTERDGGAVFITATSSGSPSEQVLGSSFPSNGLQIVRVFGETFSGKEECVALMKSCPELTGVEFELRAPGDEASSSSSSKQPTRSSSVKRTWHPGQITTVTIARNSNGIGMKLVERDDGAVLVVKTTKGSTSEQVLGSTRSLGPTGLQILSVFGQPFSGKDECIELIKSQPERSTIELEVRVAEVISPALVPASETIDEAADPDGVPVLSDDAPHVVPPAWLHGPMDKDMRQKIMIDHGGGVAQHGAFFVAERQNHPGEFVLCVGYDKQDGSGPSPTHHHVTVREDDDVLVISNKVFGQPRKTLRGFVEQLSTPGIPNWPVALATPIPAEWGVPPVSFDAASHLYSNDEVEAAPAAVARHRPVKDDDVHEVEAEPTHHRQQEQEQLAAEEDLQQEEEDKQEEEEDLIPGEVFVRHIPRGPKGIGMKLEERDDGTVYVTATLKGSPSEQVMDARPLLSLSFKAYLCCFARTISRGSMAN